jgi:hypothetical protein
VARSKQPRTPGPRALLVRYIKDAFSNSVNYVEPSPQWLRSYIQDVAEVESYDRARDLIVVLRDFFTIRRSQAALDALACPVLAQPSASAQAAWWHSIVRGRGHNKHAPDPIREARSRHVVLAWEQYAHRRHRDPVRPRAEDIADFLIARSKAHGYSSTKQALFYVGAYLLYFGSHVAQSPIVAACLQGLRRECAARYAPFDLTQLRPAMLAMGDNRQDIRDRTMILLAAFGALTGYQLVRLRKADVCFVENGVELTVGGEVRFIGPADDREIDPVSWLRTWVAGAESKTGPLFPKVYRGSEQPEPADKAVLGRALRRWLPRARVSERGGLRFSFIAASVRKNGPIATLHFLKFRRFRNAVYYAPELQVLQQQLEHQVRGQRRRGVL